MRDRGAMIIGVVFVVLGLFALFESAFHINLWTYLWPLLLIGLGIWLITHMQGSQSAANVHYSIFGDTKRRGNFQVVDEEFASLFGDTEIDLVAADIPVGERIIRCSGFIGDVKMYVPQGVGILLDSHAFVTDAKFFGEHEEDVFMTTVQLQTPGYASAERKVHLVCSYFICDVNVRQA